MIKDEQYIKLCSLSSAGGEQQTQFHLRSADFCLWSLNIDHEINDAITFFRCMEGVFAATM